jgi:shikimate kinase
VEEEGKALLHFERQGHVVSLTGSNPMYPAAMDHISKTGIVVHNSNTVALECVNISL